MKKEYKWGYINLQGEMAIAPRFDDASPFSEGLAVVKVEWARGYIDHSGAFVIEPQYQYAGPFRDGKALVEIDGMRGYVHPDGTWVEAPVPAVGNPVTLTPQVGTPDASLHFCEGVAVKIRGKKYGYVDDEEKFVIPPVYKQAQDFSEGLAAILTEVPQ